MKNFNVFLLVLYYLIIYKSVYNLRINSAETSTIETEKENISDNNESLQNRRVSINRDTRTTDERINENNKSENGSENKELNNSLKEEDKGNKEDKTKNELETSEKDINKRNEEEKDNKNNKKDLDNFASTQKKTNVENRNNESLKSLVISENVFEGAKNVCEFVVIQNEHFKKFCQMTSLFEQLEALKKKDLKLYKEVTNNSYEKDDLSNFQLLKEEDDNKIFREKDNHNPKLSILFLYERLCIGGLPLACSNLMKYDNIFEVNNENGINGANKIDDKDANSKTNDNVEGVNYLTVDGKTAVEENVSDLTENANGGD